MPSSVAFDEVGGMSAVRRSLTASGLSESAVEIISASWKSSTAKSYTSVFKQWCHFCGERQYDPSKAAIVHVIEFLTNLYDRGHSYSHINVARSALSSLFSLEGTKVGEDSLVSRFMAGVRNLRTSVPKYRVLWKAADLLSYLRDWSVDSSCLKDLSRKLVAVLACLSLQRVHPLTHIDKNVQFTDSATYLFVFHDLKIARRRPYFTIALPALSENDSIGAARLLSRYLQVTHDLRSAGCDQLFLSYTAPHAPVSADTIARWIRSVLADAGIDTSQFGAHSVCGAASSAASSLVPLDQVLRAGDWSTASTFHRHYRRRSSLLPSAAVANALAASVS